MYDPTKNLSFPYELRDAFGHILTFLTHKEQSIFSLTCRWSNHQVQLIHLEYAKRVFIQENMLYDSTWSIAQIRNSVFNFIPSFKDLPECMQKSLEPYRIEFNTKGEIQKGAFLTNQIIDVVEITLKALRPANNGIRLQDNTIVCHPPGYNQITNIFSCSFESGKWIGFEDFGREISVNIGVPDDWQNIFQVIDMFKKDAIESLPDIQKQSESMEIELCYLPRIFKRKFDPNNTSKVYIDTAFHTMYHVKRIVNRPMSDALLQKFQPSSSSIVSQNKSTSISRRIKNTVKKKITGSKKR